MAEGLTKPLWIKGPLAILAEGAENGVVVADGCISELIAAGAEPRGYGAGTDYDVFDAQDLVVVPGLVNTHHHFYQTLTRAHSDAINKPLFPWLVSLYPIWRHLTPDMVQVATRLALAELLLSGCTTAADHHYVFPQGLEEAVDIQVGEAGAMGMRALFTRGSMSLSVEDGGLPPRRHGAARGCDPCR